MVLLGHLYLGVTTTTPFTEAWDAWIAIAVFALLVGAMLSRSSKMLRLASWICYAGLVTSGVAVFVGLIGILRYSVDLAMYLGIGIAYALMLGVNLAGIQEAKHKVSDHGSTGDA